MFGQFEDSNQSNDAQERQRRRRLGRRTAHRRQDVGQRDVVGNDGRDVDDVLEVEPERHLGRARNKPDDRLDREPDRADRLDDEERIAEVRSFVARTVRLGERPCRWTADDEVEGG